MKIIADLNSNYPILNFNFLIYSDFISVGHGDPIIYSNTIIVIKKSKKTSTFLPVPESCL